MTKIHDDIIYGRTALKKGIPWIVPESLAMLETLVKPTWRVFEWGAGGSTVYFANKCKFIVSVEHNIQWYDRVHEMLLKRELRHKAYLMLVKGRKPEPDKVKGHERFRAYADLILSYPNSYFNLVFIDGEASSRGWCLTTAIPKLKKGGYLLLDDSNWIKREMTGFEREDFVAKDLKWIGQKGTFDWHTSILTSILKKV